MNKFSSLSLRRAAKRKLRHDANVERGSSLPTFNVNEANVRYEASGLRVVEPYHSWTYTVGRFDSFFYAHN